MKILYEDFLAFKLHFIKLAAQRNIDLDFYFDNEDFYIIYIHCLLTHKNPLKLTLDEINGVILNALLEAKKNEG